MVIVLVEILPMAVRRRPHHRSYHFVWYDQSLMQVVVVPVGVSSFALSALTSAASAAAAAASSPKQK